MKKFSTFWKAAAKRKGGEEALAGMLPTPITARSLARKKDDRLLSQAAQHVMSAGFAWKVVEAKWPDHEEAFFHFAPPRVAFLDEAEISALAQDRRVIRHRGKIESIRDNARFFVDVAKEHGSFAKFLAAWPEDEVIELWAHLKKNGSRLGGNTGRYFLRSVGKDTFLLSKDVVTALLGAGIVDKEPTSKRDLKKVQDAFVAWKSESGRSFAEISRTLAYTVP
jgi:3-methyladenine DNA glycosylase Tag